MRRIEDWWTSSEQTFCLGGYAGTGKTFLANKITANLGLDRVQYCSFTGKAALALKERGVSSATTIHSLIYKRYEPGEAAAAYYDSLSSADTEFNDRRRRQLHLIMNGKDPGFALNEDSSANSARLIVVDEFSMLNEEIIRDLQLFNRRILYLGDPAQLPPIEGNSPLTPDCFLDEVVRQALDNPVLRAATMVREGEVLPHECDWGNFVRFRNKADASWEICSAADQILCGKNLTRSEINKKFRKKLGMKGQLDIGDKLVCLENDHSIELYNGTVGEVTHIAPSGCYGLGGKKIHLVQGDNLFTGIQPAFPWEYEGVPAWQMKDCHKFDYGYALTVHKSQGSEWNNIVVFNEIHRMKGWLYTALTRAREKVTLVG